MFNKKAEHEGKAVSVLILIIALFMLLYVLFVPPEERQQLLYPNATSNVTLTNTVEKLELLSEIPGFVSPQKQQINDHNLVPVNLFIKTEPKSYPLAQSLTVSNALFSKSSPILYFNVDMKDLKKVTLFFSVSEASGELKVTVNKNQFYSQEVKPGVQLIEIPIAFLVEKNNELTFEASSPGLAFWSENKCSLTDVGLKEEFEMINSQEERLFTVSSIEKDSLQSATLQYFQICNEKLTTPTLTVPLKIYFNDNPVPAASQMLRCTSTQQSLDLDPTQFIAGQNKLLFVLEQGGDFTFNELKVSAQAKEIDYPSYTFAISQDQYNDVKENNKKIQIEVYMQELDNKNSKNARITVNSGDIFMQEKSGYFAYDLRDYVQEGSNFIRITPNNEFVITGLKVTLQ